MDKNLNSTPKAPWWMVAIQISPLVLQLVYEIYQRINGVAPEGANVHVRIINEPVIPPPLDVRAE